MRLFNFTITGGKVTVADLTTTSPTAYLVTSGIIGDGVANLNRKTNNLYAFATHEGDSSDEDPYGNARMYNLSVVNTTTELAMSQSFSSPVTGSAIVNFVFITDRKNEG
tara:strand:+ start:4306 stop:4632 length:327 start_codon:yes stop_codon:yes gene_type:complete